MIVVSALAAPKYLVKFSSNTYATSDHINIDTYVGVASVYGLDRRLTDNVWHYPAITRVTYNVQGNISRAEAYATGNTDSVGRKKSITVKDIWNYGPVTEAYGRIFWSISNDINPYGTANAE